MLEFKTWLINSKEHIGLFILVIFLTLVVGYLVNRFFVGLIRRSTSQMKNDPTNYIFLRHAVTGLIYIIGFSIAIYMVPELRALASSLLAGAGILAVAVGFASQHALSNIISGMFIVVFKPFRVNDRIKIRELDGVIEDITLRHTVIRNFENRRIIIPNTLISDEIIINADFEDDSICKWIEIGVSYESDIDLAKKIIQEEIIGHPLHIDKRTETDINRGEELAPVKVISLGESSVNLRGWAWAKDAADAFNLACDLNESIKRRFDEAGIEIPYPHRTLVNKTISSPANNEVV